jgi:hypothetical protein
MLHALCSRVPRVDFAKLTAARAVSSVGRAPARQAGGHWFEPSTAHLRKAPPTRGFSLGPSTAIDTAAGVNAFFCPISSSWWAPRLPLLWIKPNLVFSMNRDALERYLVNADVLDVAHFPHQP